MAYDLTTTSGITSYVNAYKTSESTKTITPLTNQKNKYQTLSNAYASLNSKIISLRGLLSDLKTTGTSSAFLAKAASSSNSSFVTASVSNSASASAYSLRVNQLAKSDIAVSQALTSSTANAITGTHTLLIKSGDGSGGEYASKVDVTFTSSETNQTMMEKIRDAINTDKAVVQSSAKTASTSYAGGASTFKINLNGTEKEITVNGGGTYGDLIDELVTAISGNVSGVTAEKVSDSPNPGDIKLKLTVTDPANYISISHVSGNDIVTDLGISATKEKGASGIVTASVFTPTTGNSQFSLTAKKSGLDYRITQIADDTGGSALAQFGLNVGSTRTTADQGTNTAGFVYSNITSAGNLLNAKLNFNGVDVQRNTNTIDDLATGVTFNLKGAMQASDTTVSVTTSNDITSVRATIDKFITKFNETYTLIKANSNNTKESRGVFITDRNAIALTSLLKSTFYNQVSGLSSDALNSLSAIGISFDANSGLNVSNSTVLEDKLTNKISEVAAMFNSTDGIANTLYDSLEPYVGAAGYLTNAKSTYDKNINLLSDRIRSAQTRIDKSALSLRTKYEQLQAQLAQIMSVQSQLNFSSSSYF